MIVVLLCAGLGVICCWIFYAQTNAQMNASGESYAALPQTSCELRLEQLKAVLLEKKEENCQEEIKLVQRELTALAKIKQIRDPKINIRD